MLPRFGDPDIYPSVRFCAPELPSLHRVPGVGSPASTVLISSLTSCHPSGQARWTLPSRSVCTPPRFAPAAWGAPLGRRPGSLVSRDPHRLLQTERAGSPRFLGEPRWPYAVLSDPGRAPRARPYSAGVLSPLWHYQDKPRRHVPFVALSHGLRPRCLRFAGALTGQTSPTQDSLPAGGQPLPGRIHLPGSLREVSALSTDVYTASLFPRINLAQCLAPFLGLGQR
jgi:hypothetical protein